MACDLADVLRALLARRAEDVAPRAPPASAAKKAPSMPRPLRAALRLPGDLELDVFFGDWTLASDADVAFHAHTPPDPHVDEVVAGGAVRVDPHGVDDRILLDGVRRWRELLRMRGARRPGRVNVVASLIAAPTPAALAAATAWVREAGAWHTIQACFTVAATENGTACVGLILAQPGGRALPAASSAETVPEPRAAEAP
jgi:hypothetical protein